MGEHLEDVGVFPQELSSGEGIHAGVRGPAGEEVDGDERAAFLGGDEVVEAENEEEAAVVGGEAVEFRVEGSGLETGLGCVGRLLETYLDCGGERPS